MKELIDSVKDFLETNLGENYIWITAGAAAVVLLIIIVFAAVKNKKIPEAGQDSARDFFMEGEYDSLIREEALASKAKAAPAESPVDSAEVAESSAEEQDALKEELQQVQININIERGHVKIGYEDDGKVTCIVETDEEELPNDPELTAALAAGDMGEAAEPEGGKEILDNRGIVLEKINLVKAAPVKKFGPDNFNTGRSGRIFTEEELREQIKQ